MSILSITLPILSNNLSILAITLPILSNNLSFISITSLLINLFDEFVNDFPISYFVYVNTNSEKCYERIHKRARDGEEVIPLTYLTDCHNYHEEFLDENKGIQGKKLILNCNVDIYENKNTVC